MLPWEASEAASGIRILIDCWCHQWERDAGVATQMLHIFTWLHRHPLDPSAWRWQHNLPLLQFPSSPHPFQNLKKLQIALQINYKHYVCSYIDLIMFHSCPNPPFLTFPIKFSILLCFLLQYGPPCESLDLLLISPSSLTTSISWPLLSESLFLGQSPYQSGPVSSSKTWILTPKILCKKQISGA